MLVTRYKLSSTLIISYYCGSRMAANELFHSGETLEEVEISLLLTLKMISVEEFLGLA